jgi:hypothetical protein
MKLCWIIGCLTVTLIGAEKAITGSSIFGDVWWARCLDAGTAGMFLVAAVSAFRTKALWTF